MSQKPEKLDEVWSEKDLCARLNLPMTKSGHSKQLSGWVLGGLEYAEKSGRRYFFESDVLGYLWQRRNMDKTD